MAKTVVIFHLKSCLIMHGFFVCLIWAAFTILHKSDLKQFLLFRKVLQNIVFFSSNPQVWDMLKEALYS